MNKLILFGSGYTRANHLVKRRFRKLLGPAGLELLLWYVDGWDKAEGGLSWNFSPRKIINQIGMPEPTFFRAKKQLEDLGILEVISEDNGETFQVNLLDKFWSILEGSDSQNERALKNNNNPIVYSNKNNKGDYQNESIKDSKDELPEDPFTPDIATVRWNALAKYINRTWGGFSSWKPKQIGSPDVDTTTREIFKRCGFEDWNNFKNMVVYLCAINELHYQALESNSIKLQEGYLPGSKNKALNTHMKEIKGEGEAWAAVQSVKNLKGDSYKMNKALKNALEFANHLKGEQDEDSNSI